MSRLHSFNPSSSSAANGDGGCDRQRGGTPSTHLAQSRQDSVAHSTTDWPPALPKDRRRRDSIWWQEPAIIPSGSVLHRDPTRLAESVLNSGPPDFESSRAFQMLTSTSSGFSSAKRRSSVSGGVGISQQRNFVMRHSTDQGQRTLYPCWSTDMRSTSSRQQSPITEDSYNWDADFDRCPTDSPASSHITSQ
ncbi:hypothetical protein SUNI508_05969 [Seiridium unicorne]|uniref:Uncharacterized protein n=1 Tax=Seiridium unicorne TaxID=138068 RepID=A0ABR2V3N2_9PEZI